MGEMAMRRLMVAAMVLFFLACALSPVLAGPPPARVGERERCPVCGMFVAKYPNWIVRVWAGGKWYAFDGVKDMMAWRFHPEQYGGTAGEIGAVWVRDYYTLEWVDGRKAFYVVGSDVYGPMGHELVPFASRPAAENFLQDHRGREIVTFDSVTPELISSLRRGMRMR